MQRVHRWTILGVCLAGLFVLIPVGRFIGFGQGTDHAYSPHYRRLLDHLGSTRPTEARISGSQVHRPYRSGSTNGPPVGERMADPPSRGVAAQRHELPPRRKVPTSIAAAIQKAVRGNPSPENQAALAILNLVEGNPQRAVELLRVAHARKPGDPRLVNDLAAALLAASDATNSVWLALEALEATQLSIKLDRSPTARFNLALILEKLGARSQAIVAWNEYLDEDARSDWAQEANQHLERLEELVAKQPRLLAEPAVDTGGFGENSWATRQLAERTLLARLAKSASTRWTLEADAALAEVEDLAATLPRQAGRLLEASTIAIREARRNGDQVRLDRLVRGHRSFGEAFLLRRRERASEALRAVESAIRDLRSAKSPFELRARLLRAWLAEPPNWTELQQLEQEASAKGFPSIAAEARRIVAYRLSLEGRFESSVRAYREARRRYEALGEWEEAAVISVMLAQLHEMLGRQDEAAADLAAALDAGPWVADPWSRYCIYVVAAGTAADRSPHAAVALRLEAADACRDLPERPLCEVDSALWVAALTSDPTLAESSLERAGELLTKVPDSQGKKRTEIDLLAAKAQRLAGGDRTRAEREEAAELFDRAAAAYEVKGLAVSSSLARADRAKVLQTLGQPEESAAEYRVALEAFRRWDERDRFRPEQAEQSSPRRLRTVYEALIDLELEASAEAPGPVAFLLSEEMRDRLAPRKTAGLWLPDAADLARMVSSVPTGTAVIEYALTPGHTVAWILANGRLDQLVLTPSPELAERIASLGKQRDLDAWKSTSGALFQEIIEPVLKRLPRGTDRLFLVPDSELYDLPFRALWDPASGRYLDEDFTVALTPSVRQLLRSDDSSETVPGDGALPVLSLGFTEFPSDLGLEDLPLAGMEADAVRSLYGLRRDGECRAADWTEFRSCALRAEVIHLATHASANSTVSTRSWLAFRQETVSLDRLWHELPDLSRRRPLVVLSACQSVAAAGGGEGLGGLARPFLASGARAVVGTLWRIADEDAAQLFPVFHRAWQASNDTASALRTARAELLGWAERPWVWGGVESVNAGPLR